MTRPTNGNSQNVTWARKLFKIVNFLQCARHLAQFTCHRLTGFVPPAGLKGGGRTVHCTPGNGRREQGSKNIKMAAATILILSLAHVFINQVNRGRIYSHMRGGWSEMFDSMDE